MTLAVSTEPFYVGYTPRDLAFVLYGCFAVMTSSARTRSRARYGVAVNCRHVAVVELDQVWLSARLLKEQDPRPKAITERARGVVRIHRKWAYLTLSKSSRTAESAYTIALKEANKLAWELNAKAQAGSNAKKP